VSAEGSFWPVYALSAFLSLLLIFLVWNILPHGKAPSFKKIYFFSTVKNAWAKKDIFRIIVSNVLLHVFFAWMIIYMPPYLHNTVGFSWGEIGVLFTIMLLPYILVDIPLGVLADKTLGEKELLFAGFIILIVFTFPMGFVTEKSFFLWAFLLFMSRVGAGTIEIMIETFFFKQVEAGDGNLISLFRNGQPLAYIFAPALGSVFIFIGASEGFLFMILPALMLAGPLLASQLKDTR
jgi:MFS family permease